MDNDNFSIRSLSDEEMNMIGGGVIPVIDNPITIIINIIESFLFD